ncbi:MAG: hypothetical protein RBR68_15090 [Tenuifilaceae bacterium]|nr:hypothetical protein [Tenuifilaceae bacterium]
MTKECRICGSIISGVSKEDNYCPMCDSINALKVFGKLELPTALVKTIEYFTEGTEDSGIDYEVLVNAAIKNHHGNSNVAYCEPSERPFPKSYGWRSKTQTEWFTKSHIEFQDDYGKTHILINEFSNIIGISIHTDKWYGYLPNGKHITEGDIPYICSNCGGAGCSDCGNGGLY